MPPAQDGIAAHTLPAPAETIVLRIPPWNMAVYMRAVAAALNAPQHKAIRRKYGVAWFVFVFSSIFLMVWLLRKYAMPTNPQAILICVFWGCAMADVFRYMQNRVRMKIMKTMHADFMDGYEIHINLTNGMITFVTPFCQVFVEKRHIRCIKKIGEHFIFMPQFTLMFYHLPQSVLHASGHEAHVRRFFDGKLPA